MDKFRKTFKKIVNISKVLNKVTDNGRKFVEKPNLLNGIALASNSVEAYDAVSSNLVPSILPEKKWIAFAIPMNKTFVINCLAQSARVKTLNTQNIQDSGTKRVILDIDGIKIGVSYKNKNIAWSMSFYYNTDDVLLYEDGLHLKAIGECVWDMLGNNITISNENSRGFVPTPDRLAGDILPSEKAKEIWERTQALQKFGNRAILLVGEPGTGKSEILKYVGQKAGNKTLRMSYSETCDVENILSWFKMLEPSALLIDDIDRDGSSTLMSSFELIKKSCTLFIASANDPSMIDYAALRPGRFDDYIVIDKIDRKVVEHMLKGCSENLIDKIYENFPIAYVEEFSKLYKAFGEEQAIKEFSVLEERRNSIIKLQEEGRIHQSSGKKPVTFASLMQDFIKDN